MNKKFLFSLLLVGLLAVQFAPVAVLADEEVPGSCTMRADVENRLMSDCPPKGDNCPFDDDECGICCLLSSVLYATDIIFMGLIALVVVFVLLGAFTIVTAGGASEKVNTGRNYILYAGVGLAAALLARAVPALVKYIIG